ncbi:MAG: hypothetical protein WBA68_09635 [Alteraurantiacibacter sp.]
MRRSAVLASLALGTIGAMFALDTAPAASSSVMPRTARGSGEIVNALVDLFGPVGAAMVCVFIGVTMAIVSALLCSLPHRKRG